MVRMRSLKYKLVLLFLPLCLVPLIGISALSYFLAKERITEDRIVLYLEQIAQDIAVTIQLTLLEKKEEVISMSLYGEFRDALLKRTSRSSPERLLNELVKIHDVYDIIALFDADGRLIATNTINRNRILGKPLDEEKLAMLRGQNLERFTPDSSWLRAVRSGHVGYIDWHRSPLVHRLYDYVDDDIQRQYSIGFAAPIIDERGVVIGGVLALLNWESVQEILDKVEQDLQDRQLTSGYAILLGSDHDTIIAHKYRQNRSYDSIKPYDFNVVTNNYGTRLREDHHLDGMQRAVEEGRSYYSYEYTPGKQRISGLALVNDEYFHWAVGVGINDEDIFAPVKELKKMLILAATISAILIMVLTYSVARRLSIPVKRLTMGANVIAAGDFSQRVTVSGNDEIGELAKTFNGMARSLEERSQALLDLNRQLEEKVRERTRKLQEASEQASEAYQELKETQVQLIQSEKMASLGQLVAGIAHEIKNPLNFIYGNTEFLKSYVENLKNLIGFLEARLPSSQESDQAVTTLKDSMNYDFMLEDLDILIRNFEEGARRINSIIGDLRTFSRMDGDEFRDVDIRQPIELALNLLQNEYRDRVRIHKEFGELPLIQCDSGKLSQVFMNLLVNACHAIPEEGDIWIRTFARDGDAVVEIEDNGVGIEEKHRGKVFEPFFTTKPVGKGTGLGLSITYGIIQQHHGKIELESQPGKGTLFRVCLPFRAAKPQES